MGFLPNVAKTLLLGAAFWGVNTNILTDTNGINARHDFPFMMTPAHAATPQDQQPMALQGMTWHLVEWSETAPLANVPVTIKFDADSFSGNASCNNYRGTYAINNGTLSVNRMISTTRKACPEAVMDQEKRIIRVLPKIRTYRIEPNGHLVLNYTDRSKAQTLTFIPESQLTALHNTEWQLISLAGNPPIADFKPPTIAFSGDRLSGTGGCNRLMGQFTVAGDKLTIEKTMAMTMMACPEPLMQQEQAFVKALTSAQGFEIVNETELIITTGDGQQLKFSPLSPPPPTDAATKGIEKLIYVAPNQADCVGVGPQKCLQIKDGSLDQPWKLHYVPIKGFDYEPGYLYQLRIRETKVNNPPADGSSVAWELIAVEAKTPQPNR